MKAIRYVEIAKYGIKKEITFKVNYISSLFSFAIHVFVLITLWNQSALVEGYSRKDLMYHIIIGECVYYSVGIVYKKISQMQKEGSIANMLSMPIHFIVYTFFEELSSLIKLLVNVIFAVILAVVFVGPFKMTGIQTICLIISLLNSFFIGTMIQILIGITSFFIEENKSIYLVVQKLQLLIILSPLALLPKLVQQIYYYLPTTYMILAPSEIFIHYEFYNAIRLLMLQLLSFVILLLATVFLYKKGVKQINVYGG